MRVHLRNICDKLYEVVRWKTILHNKRVNFDSVERGIMSDNNLNNGKQNKKRGMSAREIALCAVMIALALILSYVERLIGLDFVTPGIKLGLCNLVIVCAIYLLGVRYALIISIARIFLVGFMFGNMAAILYSLAGGLLSLAIMALLHRFTKLSVVAVSCIGGICHNVGQLLVAMAVVENTSLVLYLPALLIAGFITGLIIGIVSRLILPAVRKGFAAESRR